MSEGKYSRWFLSESRRQVWAGRIVCHGMDSLDARWKRKASSWAVSPRYRGMDIETKRFCFLYHKRLRNWWQLFPVRGWLPLLVFSYGAKKGGTTRIIVPDPAAVGPGTFFIWKKAIWWYVKLIFEMILICISEKRVTLIDLWFKQNISSTS